MIYLLSDCDEYLVSQRIGALKAALGDAEMADLNTTELAGNQTHATDILGHAAMMPFLTERRLVVVVGFLSNLDKRMAASTRMDSAANVEAGRFLEDVATVPETCDLVFLEAGLSKQRRLWKGMTVQAKGERPKRQVAGLNDLIKQGVITLETHKAPEAKTLPSWIQQRAKAGGFVVEGRAVQMLAAYVGPNLRQLDNELDKLATYAAGRAITADDVNLLVSDASEAMIWDLTDALSQRNGGVAMRKLFLLRRADANPFYLLTMIARQYRIMLKVKEAVHNQSGRPSGNEYAIAELVGERPYPVKKAMQQSIKYSFDDLTTIMERLLAADFAMKTGADADTEIDVLIAELTQRP